MTFITLARMEESNALRMLATVALVFSMASRCNAKALSIRGMTIFLVCYEAVVVAICVGGIAFLAYQKGRGGDGALSIKDFFGDSRQLSTYEKEALGEALNQGNPLAHTSMLLVPALYAVPVAQYMALLLRFDWHQSASSLSGNVVVLEQVEPRQPRCARRKHLITRTGPGLLLPTQTSLSSIIPRSARSYYNMALLICVPIYLGLAPLIHNLLATYVFPGIEEDQFRPIEDQIFSAMALFSVIPVLAAAIAIKARLRGEQKDLWTYTESWIGNKAVATPANVVSIDAAASEEKASIDLEQQNQPLITLTEAIKS